MKHAHTLSLLAAFSRARTGRFLAINGLWLALCANCFALIPPQEKYRENTETVPAAETITGGEIRMQIENTIRLTPAPISAMHPFLKAIRLNNGDLIVNCPLSGGTHRDYGLSPKEDGDVCSLRSKDNGKTWHKSRSQTSEDGGKTWVSKPTVARRGARLEDGSFIMDYGRNQCLKLDATADKQGDNAMDGYGEPWLQRAANGDLLVFVRVVKFLRTGETVHRPKYPPVKVARSKDEGKTWSEPIEVHPTGVMPVATLLDNGIIVAFTGRGGNRVAASRDNGLTWHCQHNLMFTGQSPNFSGHNAIVPVGGGRALLIYSHNHRHPDNKEGFAEGNRYGSELIGTFVSFSEDVR